MQGLYAQLTGDYLSPFHIYMSQAQKRDWKRDNEVQSLHNNCGVLMWMLADLQMNHGGSNAHVQLFSHWKIGTDNHYVII